jgi:hypothetical protein
MNHLRGLSIVVSILCVAFATSGVLAAVPIVMSHQGRLLDSSDQPLTGTYTLTYSIYEVPTGGAPLWTEDHVGVQVVDGLFSVELGSTVPLSPDVLSGSGGGGGGGGATVVRYLQIQVSGQSPISPRTQLLASPYAVASSRVSGDIETAPGGITATDLPSSLVVSVTASDPETQLSATKSGHKRFGIGIGQPDNPLGTRMALGDLNRDGLLDVVATNGESRMTLVDSTGSGGAVVSSSVSSGLGLQPMGGNILIHAGNATRSSRSSIECAPDSVVSTQSTNANGLIKNMRSRINELEARLTLETDLDGDGIADLATDKYVDNTTAGVGVSARGTGSQSSNANIAAVLNGNTVIGCRRYTDGSGIPDNSCTMTSSDLGASCKTSGSKGFYYVLTNAGSGIAADATTQVAADVNNNGHAERSVWQKVDNSTALSSTTVDLNDDGVPDVGTEISAKVPRSVLKSYFQTGDKPTSSQFRAISDSAGASATVEVDLNHDSNPDGGCVMDAEETRSQLKTYFETGDIPDQGSRVVNSADSTGASTAVMVDFDGDGVADNSAKMSSNGDGSKVVVDYRGIQAFVASSFADSTKLELSSPSGGVSLKTNSGSRNIGLHVSDVTGQCKLAMVDATLGIDDTTIVIDGNLKRFGIGVSQPEYPIQHSSGAHLTAAGDWTNASDENLKENFSKVDGEELLEKIEELPISRWNYRIESDDVAHIGPTAQDFKKTFGVGSDGKTISTIDPSGIALAAIKELNKQNRELKEENSNLKKRIDDLAEKVEKLASGK